MKDSCCEIDDNACCDSKVSEDTAICKECGSKWKPVNRITLKSLVKEPTLEAIGNPDGFYFCETPDCGVVYFNNEQQVYLHKDDVKARVGIKETENPVPVCYCFGWTQEKIFEQIKQSGFSTAVREIGAKVKAGECTCDIKNPSGRCCIGNVNKVVKRGKELYRVS
ncbi:Copper chaperone CopZ [uncultured archaeon]|nr:Copper chaperone CopZ [uncultured archaeon]